MRADLRLVLPAVVGWVAVGVLIGLPPALLPGAIVCWVLAGMAAAIAILAPRWRALCALATMVAAISALLLSCTAFASAARSPALLTDAADGGRYVTLVAVVTLDSPRDVRTERVPVTISEARVGERELRGLAIPALLFGDIPAIGVGGVVEASGTIVLADDGDEVRFLVFARGSPRVVAEPPWYLAWSTTLRAGFRAEAANLPGDGGALLPGLAIGDTSAVSPALDTAMKATSLSHLTAVSGANCAVVVALVMLVGRGVGASRRIRIAVSLVVLAGFVVLVTPDASVLRAAVMATIVLGSMSAGRPASGLPVLSLAVVALLALDPWLSRDFGFILSVLATAGLLTLAGPLARILGRWLPTPLAVLISIPLAAQLACQPVLILLNPAIPVYGVVANLLAEPAAPVATVLGLIGCAGITIIEPVGRVVTVIAWLPSAWIAAIARFFAEAPGAQAPWLADGWGLAALAAVTAAIVFVVLRPGWRHSRTVAAALVLCLVGYVGAVAGAQLAHRASVPPGWQIAACDIGQGDAVVVRSLGEVALIDTGPSPELLDDCLDELGIGRIQLLILSHYDLDHVGGTDGVLGRVDRAIVGPVSDASDERLRTMLRNGGAQVDEVARGDTGMLGEFRWEVLWPPARLGTIQPGNPASVTVTFDGVGECASGCLSSLFLGDLGEEAQSRMLGAAHPGVVDVVKVAHHGSADQCERLYDAVRARVGIISVGAGNTYGHPTDALLGILRRAGTIVTRTDLEGMVLLSPAPGGGVAVWTQHPPDRDVGAH
ncbi:competence protein ComEC [Cryobacterium mesophilum]|uniref:MBL fold metallo-hydrolase n=1 Tax=Terrimesophilobacter mesophilus TaxID=433647 RepID=A0A4V3I9D6_9MICO|nr:ComEC/Rec2 family competence protein [Terrimesophilobacter mesophilus]MBB5632268.1 competence protein ComEC [Terrimesophilobacter mesophilus]TFB79118.1 MBL fold metallo-hydrolase [Terrimesophilobacter mesophilus]